MTLPTLHLNGTSGEELLAQYGAAMADVARALVTLRKAAPNGRDYYPQGPAAYSQAAAEHEARVIALSDVYTSLQNVWGAVYDQHEARQSAKRRPTS